ncbi:hypothetical protein ACDQ55_14365 [Chitinophaga sp. 30R24]|uniref:hypothetical protein n=1 Tax=Chitinophaga sp. 30R24 TaxID=3248838 RepID=UPI003B900700
MKTLICAIPMFLITLFCTAQSMYQIKADSVRIYSTCDTAELILENRTKNVSGFLFNKGGGRTEFQRLRLIDAGNNSIAIQGQDTLHLGNLLSSVGDSRYDLISTNFLTIPNYSSLSWTDWPTNKVIGYQAYTSPDMPTLSEQAFQPQNANNYYIGLVARDTYTGFDFTVNWNGESFGPNGAFLRIKDDTYHVWSAWRELVFKDFSDKSYIRNQHTSAQPASLWISGAATIGDKVTIEDKVTLNKYKNNATEDSMLSVNASGELKLKKLEITPANYLKKMPSTEYTLQVDDYNLLIDFPGATTDIMLSLPYPPLTPLPSDRVYHVYIGYLNGHSLCIGDNEFYDSSRHKVAHIIFTGNVYYIYSVDSLQGEW